MADTSLDTKLAGLARQYDEVGRQLGTPEVLSDPNQLRRLGRELSRLEPVVAAYRELGDVREQLAGALDMLHAETDEEMKSMARDEVAELEARETQLIEDLKVSLIPRDPNDDRNVIVEIRAGAGGEEAALFAAELLRMYSRYALEHRFHTDLMSLNETGIGGIKEAILEVAGDGAYSRLKFEGGVHRVQRVPSTESSGRIHTSTATVIVLPEVDEVEVEIDEARDLRIDVKRASGPGGQSVNTTDSAVRITHLPTGPGGRDPGREEPAQEQGQGAGGPPLPPVRPAAGQAARGAERRAADDGPGGRPVGEDQDLQLPRQPGDRPPHRHDDPQRPGRPRGPAGPADRRARHGGPGGPPSQPHGVRRWARRRRPRPILSRRGPGHIGMPDAASTVSGWSATPPSASPPPASTPRGWTPSC